MGVRPKVQPSPPPSPFVDSHGAAQFLRLSEQTLANWRLRGNGPPFAKIGTKILYSVDDLLAYVAERKVRSTSEVEYCGKPRGRPPKAGKPAPDAREQPAPLASPASDIAELDNIA
jgi:hypothetical protein